MTRPTPADVPVPVPCSSRESHEKLCAQNLPLCETRAVLCGDKGGKIIPASGKVTAVVNPRGSKALGGLGGTRLRLCELRAQFDAGEDHGAEGGRVVTLSPLSVSAVTQHLCCHLGCRLYPNGTAQSFYEVTLNRTAFLSFHVPNATWERRWPGELPVATFAQEQLMKYPITTQDLQYFLNTTCVSILQQAQSARTGPWWGWGQGHGGVALWSCCHLHPSRLLQEKSAADRTLHWYWGWSWEASSCWAWPWASSCAREGAASLGSCPVSPHGHRGQTRHLPCIHHHAVEAGD